jgi:hypothetical protein
MSKASMHSKSDTCPDMHMDPEGLQLHGDVSRGYSAGYHIVVAVVIMDQCVSTIDGYCDVVNKPKTDTRLCFCLPGAVVSFKGSGMIKKWLHSLSQVDAADENHRPCKPEGNRPAQVFPQRHAQALAPVRRAMGYTFWG